ncbi:MAG: ATP-dependent RNA helicase HrpA [Burkholderiales bacterium]|nr:ATP-dependent RNA helicase HrpA [Burkholderiales bacterium]
MVSLKIDPEQRLRNLPQPAYPEALPVVAKREDIARAIAGNQVVIVCGETGSGKTTQLPKICLELKRGVAGLIGHTQPRRIAARTVAARIAAELKSPLGHAVGYQVRFADKLSANTYIKLMTDGILLAETQGDRLLQAYDTLIIDEAHERSLNIDFLLGYVKRLLPRRPDLKVIVTSATIDAERFSKHFNDAPVIEVSGRTWPVEMRYRPLGSTLTPAPLAEGGGRFELSKKGKKSGMDDDRQEQDMEQAILDAVDELARERAGGDILVFLPGEREIRDTAELLRKHHPKGAEILPLYARLSFEEQARVFRPGGSASATDVGNEQSGVSASGRGSRTRPAATVSPRPFRIVLATNVAETSLTVPGIHYVIDTGVARINRYSHRNKVEQLQVEKISRASANQRAGRCGRVAAGVCIRLYSEDDYAARPEYTEPEILRSSLAAVILRMKSLKIGEVEDFPFLDPPGPRMIADGYQLLAELGAVDERNRLTPVGWQLAKFPIDPRIARMIVAAKQEQCLAEVLIIAAALTVQDPRERPFERAQAADRAHQQFQDERSDFMGYLKLWQFFDDALQHKKSNRKLTELLHENFLSHRRMREWRDIHGQLAALTAELGMRANETPATYEQIHRALLAGLLGNIGFRNEEGEYLGARGIKFTIFPGSVLRKARPRWVMAAELAETTRLYARCVAKIEPEWIEPVARPLVSRHYFDPHWEKERAMAVAFERVTLYGLTIVSKRRVHYGAIHPAAAREIFIRALAAGEYATRAKFYEYNQILIKEVQELEHKTRRRDVLVDEQAIFDFYDALIPPDIVNGAAFEKWRRAAEQANPKLLYLTRDYLMRHAASDITEAQFPETLRAADTEFRLKYRFDPGHPLDGVTAIVPLALLNKLETTPFDWLVPGLIREKVAFAFKALPKAIRRNLVPVPEPVTAFLTECEKREAGGVPLKGVLKRMRREAFADAIRRFVQRATGAPVATDVLEAIAYPPHLRMNFRVIDDAGRELASGRDLAALKEQLGQAAQLTFGRAGPGIERDNLRAWDFGDLPQEISFTRSGRKLTGYPALTDAGDSVAIRLFDVPQTAQAAMRAGVARLVRLMLKEQMKQLEKNLRGFEPAALQLRSVAGADDLREDLIRAIADRAFIGEDALPRTQQEFEAQMKRARTRLPAVSEAACRLFAAVADEYHRVSLKLAAARGELARPVADIRAQLSRLIYKGFFSATPWEQLAHLPRYLKAMQLRLEKCPRDPQRDAKHAHNIAGLWKRYEERLDRQREAGGAVDPRLEAFRWHLEELRVSLFAQELKTPYPVSCKRLDKIWNAIMRGKDTTLGSST